MAKWSDYADPPVQLLTTELNGVADAAYATLGAEVNFVGQGLVAADTWLDVSIELASGVTATGVNPSLDIYMFAKDTSGYFLSASGPAPFEYVVIRFGALSGSTFTRATREKIEISPNSYKFMVHNRLGASLPGSGNVLIGRHYSLA